MHPDIFPYQKDGALYLANHTSPNAILADAMGLGKSLQAIAAADLIGAMNVLVLCPGIARSNWCREWEKWQTTKRTVKAIYASKDPVVSQVVVCSYSLLPQRKALAKLLARQWDLIIADEGHLLSNRTSKRCRTIYGNRSDGQAGLKSKTARFWVLTGTLISNNLGEVWTHCRALFPEVVKGVERYNKWLDMFCTVRDTEYGTVVVGSKNTAEFGRRIRPYVLRRTAEQVLPDLPSLRISTVLVDPETLPPRSAEIDQVEKVLSAALALSAKGDTEAAREAMRSMKEFHISSLRKWTGISKAAAVAQQVCADFASGLDKLILFAVHTEVIDTLHAGIPNSAVIDGRTSAERRDRLIQNFQSSGLNASPVLCLIIQLSIGSTALTLTAASHVSFCETSWTPKDVMQAIGRVRRIGQRRPVLAKIYTLKGSVDEQVSATLARKTRDILTIEQGLAA